ncbi:TIGR03620 family F420-dependent LLM class oxidoreductase [Micromonospora sp. WMMD998]|uniref:TIGR03620 family F420-dependent LLM class oxidoreductase n=1 Tax=Micromonospora sp. WMMD998 TaxID=3016092 RepID=UPI00249B492E|nr:TIGR03620 family F420-dependent LLM class oxidoreductase [Micromonospora sp. WMMD998]WFE38818.1 TIGR03620 family F420-dependent LLM class oxidoreductase [Micromonospora sp. WMMD998]
MGIWTRSFNFVPARVAADAARFVEDLGFDTIWIGETGYREALTHAGVLLSATRRCVIGTGVASIWARDPMATATAQLTLHDAHPGRFLLGLGVSHAGFVRRERGADYRRPVQAMTRYLDRMDSVVDRYEGHRPALRPARLLAALRPRMLDLARTRADGALSYLVPVSHTASARAALGPDRILCVEQGVILGDPADTLDFARAHLSRYLAMTNYRNSLLQCGFTAADLADGGSARLVEALLCRGDVDQAAERVRSHLEAGADHVCLQVISPAGQAPPMREWRLLASLRAAVASPPRTARPTAGFPSRGPDRTPTPDGR